MVFTAWGSPEVRDRDHGVRKQDAFHGPQAILELRDASRFALDDEDLEARLIAQMGVCGRTDRSEEVVLPMENPMGYHADVVPIYDCDRSNDLAPALTPSPHEGPADEFSESLGPAPETFVLDETIEILQKGALEGNSDSFHGHVLPPIPESATDLMKRTGKL